jgi:magnesium chelatase family protein
VAESRERIRAALHAIGLALPGKRLVVNLSPADLPKEGSHFDLPITLAVLAALGIIPQDFLTRYVAMGELALDGALIAVSGVLPAAIAANGRDLGLICPKPSGPEAAWAAEDADILAPENLIQLINHVRGTQVLTRPRPSAAPETEQLPDLKDIKGQETGKRALEVAAAGGHHFLMVGPPGAGKSMLAQRLPSILPPMDSREMLDVSMVASLAGQLANGQLSRRRPFRAPHHSASMPALVGGGLRAKPGEMALAHHGVLFLDELPEFQPRVLESLRQPMETGETVVARVNYHITYPARFQLIAAMNPCKCGFAGQPGHICRNGPRCAADYQARISGPLLDRMDIQIELAAVKASDLTLPPPKEASADVAQRVLLARQIQAQRLARLGRSELRTNAEADGALLEEISRPEAPGLTLLRDAADAMKLSARGYHRVLRVARTLADLDRREQVARIHIAEALSYRQKLSAFTAAA